MKNKLFSLLLILVLALSLCACGQPQVIEKEVEVEVEKIVEVIPEKYQGLIDALEDGRADLRAGSL